MRHDHPRCQGPGSPDENVMAHGFHQARPSIESALLWLCTCRQSSVVGPDTLVWLSGRSGKDLDGSTANMVSDRVWRAFYLRHPDAMRESGDPRISALAKQVSAQLAAEAAAAAIDAMLAHHGRAKTNT